MKSVAILGGKGGSTKTASSHLVCLGAYLHGIPAAYALTDPQRKVRGEGRPYAVLDGRLPEQLALILDSSRSNLNGWLLEGLGKAFPQRIIAPPIPFVNSISDLLSSTLASPSTSVRQAARRSFESMSDYYDAHCPAEKRAMLEAMSA